jgi:hypothetical protein
MIKWSFFRFVNAAKETIGDSRFGASLRKAWKKSILGVLNTVGICGDSRFGASL